MAKRSLQASPEGIEQAKKAFTRKGWTQDNLAGEVNLKTRQPIWRFFSGQKIERWTFMEVCTVLGLDWREIAIDPPAEFGEVAEATVLDIDTLVKQVRTQCFEKIQDQCGILQLLDVSRPVSIDDIYIDINISEEIAGIHVQTIRKIESGGTSRLSQKGKSGLAAALSIPQEYLDAVVKQTPIEATGALKFCPKCWTPGTTLDPMWTSLRSKYCFACGTTLRDRCGSCNEPIMSLKFKFCPYCGESYKQT